MQIESDLDISEDPDDLMIKWKSSMRMTRD